jgi:hypothetical protein
MKKQVILALVLALFINAVDAQDRYFTRGAKVVFVSETELEKIVGTNSQGTNVYDTKTGQFEFAVLMKSFVFEKALLEEHFNENYAESSKYPKSTFKGMVEDPSKVNLAKDGVYPVKIKGQLTMHGVTKDVATKGVFEVKGGKIIGKSNFIVTLADYKIEIPSLVKDKISKDVKISVISDYQKM